MASEPSAGNTTPKSDLAKSRQLNRMTKSERREFLNRERIGLNPSFSDVSGRRTGARF